MLTTANKIVSVSEFSQGKSGKIFNDVNNNKREYIVMKNNSPIAVIVPMEEYDSYMKRIEDLEKRLKAYSSGIIRNKRIGVAQGLFEVPDDFDDWDMGFGEVSYEDLA